MAKHLTLVDEVIINKIHLIIDQKVMLDTDLAVLYGVPTKALNQAVKRNLQRFPKDFMFRLSAQEFTNLRSQIVTSNSGSRRTPPYTFTEQGVAMLSGFHTDAPNVVDTQGYVNETGKTGEKRRST